MNVKAIKRTMLSVALALVTFGASAQTDTTRRNAQSAAAAAAKLLTQTEEKLLDRLSLLAAVAEE